MAKTPGEPKRTKLNLDSKDIVQIKKRDKGIKDKFNLPHELYQGQKDFIKDATEIIRNNRLGILESPTGTGKTLSSLITAMEYLGDSEFITEGVSKANADLLKSLYNRTNKRVIYACRTHTQLDQVVKELEGLNKYSGMHTSGVVLGSRRQTCINYKVNGSKDINNMCRSTIKDRKCSFYNNLQDGKAEKSHKNTISIEEAISLGNSCRVCPYFYLKHQARNASIIILPYSLLLQKDFFSELGIQMSETVLIIDEAHNLYSTVLDEYSASISESELSQIIPVYSEYMNKQEGKRKVDFLELFIFVSGVFEYLKRSSKKDATDPGQAEIYNINRFLIDAELDHINLLEIAERIDPFLPSKVFPMRTDDVENKKEDILRRLCKLVRLLGECDRHSYIVKEKGQITLKNIYPSDYLSYFVDIKSILAIGGTLTQSSDISLLFNREVTKRTYPSVCKNIQVAICSDYSFVYTKRNEEVMRAFSLAMLYYKKIEKGGILLFVQSKSVLSILKLYTARERISNVNILFEGTASMQEYKERLKKERKVLMVCVMGGNFSEGINFSNDLCRVLIICGIPLPKPTEEILLIQKTRGEDYFIDKGMQAVNQTIGRSIRAENDYSCVLLLDKRFVKYKEKLSKWLQPYIVERTSSDALDPMVSKINEWHRMEKK
ncbi:chromosome transmission fidelity protein 1 [Nematocida ausubeli]|nr:chromosome transmission fidelity protein 1 [Nematocida ausubeli]KAI5150276.1 chromosome transmission fidelity protein 1 [Nematocida ausubeli]